MSTNEEAVEDAPKAVPSAKKPRGRGRPITPENAKAMALSAAKAKKMRKEARAKMLVALTQRLDLGDELVKAMKGKDDKYLCMIERATRLVGLQHDQSPDAVAQRIALDAKANVKQNSTVKLILEDLTKEDFDQDGTN